MNKHWTPIRNLLLKFIQDGCALWRHIQSSNWKYMTVLLWSHCDICCCCYYLLIWMSTLQVRLLPSVVCCCVTSFKRGMSSIDLLPRDTSPVTHAEHLLSVQRLKRNGDSAKTAFQPVNDHVTQCKCENCLWPTRSVEIKFQPLAKDRSSNRRNFGR